MFYNLFGRGKDTNQKRTKKPVNRTQRFQFEELENRDNPSAFYVVPGAAGESTAVDFAWVSRDAAYWNEIGVYAVQDAAGTVGGVAPSASGYAQAALSKATPVFVRGETEGARRTLTFKAGTILAFYMAQNTTTTTVLQTNPANNANGPVAFFSVNGASPDRFDHAQGGLFGAGMTIAFEDGLRGGDRDFDDAVIRVAPTNPTLVPGAKGQITPTAFRIDSRDAAFNNEIGIFMYDDASGAVNGIRPGEPGYAEAALRSATRQIIFRSGSGEGAIAAANLPAAGRFGFYMIQNSTTVQFLQTNPKNLPNGGPVAFFSLPQANPDGMNHIRHNGAQVFFEDGMMGGDQDFDDFVISYTFLAPMGKPTPAAPPSPPSPPPPPPPPPVPDTTAPTVTATLTEDTFDPARTASRTDKITSNSSITGTVTDASAITALQARLGTSGNFTSILSSLSGNAYTITANQMRSLNGGDPLDAGTYTIQVRATDAAGNTSQPTSFTFTLDLASTATLLLDPASDTGVQGDFRTETEAVVLRGTAEAGATVRLVRQGVDEDPVVIGTTTANSSGEFSFTGVALASGPNGLKVFTTDIAGNVGESGITLTLNDAPVANGSDIPVAGTSGGTSMVDLADAFTDSDEAYTIIHFDTSLGGFDIQLFDTVTPEHVQNFLDYVTSGAYADSFIHRSIPGFIIQGGGFTYEDGSTPNFAAIPENDEVTNEPGLPNSRGTIALAKISGDPNSGTSEWFFNLGDNSQNLDNQNGGFTVFGQVVGNGQSVIDAIAAVQRFNFSSTNSAFSDIPLRDFTGSNLQQATEDNYVIINSVSVVEDPLTYTVVDNSNTTLVTGATIVDGQLNLTYAAGESGTATITVRATDRDGASVTQTFVVTVPAV